MRKQTKLVAVLSAAALLAIGASMTSFAAGWQKDDDGTWHYYDSDDDMVEDEWRKDGGKWFYLDEDGNMAVDTWVDDDYYVGEDGSMLINAWKKTVSDDEINDPDEDGEHWYYFGSRGKKFTDGSKKINGKTYYFDEDGKMQDGWYEKDGQIYYLGLEDEGGRAENEWLWLEKPGDSDDDHDDAANYMGCDDTTSDPCDDEGWYYFGSGGKMYRDIERKRVNGRDYYFNAHGQMLYEWINDKKVSGVAPASQSHAALDGTATPSNAEATHMLYLNQVEEGWRADGWYQIDGSEDADTANDTDWYYFKDGKAKKADAFLANGAYDYSSRDFSVFDDDGPVFVKRFKLAASKGKQYFAFNELGQMQDGLQYLPDDRAFYYFDDNGYMKTGKVANVECDDDSYDFYFNTKNGKNGQGLSGEKSGYLYFNGKKLVADDDYRLYYYADKVYLVNTKGKIQKSNKKYDIENRGIEQDDVYVTFNSNDTVKEIKFDFNGASVTWKADKLVGETLLANSGNAGNNYGDLYVDDDGKYSDYFVSIPFIQLYDDDVYTYDLTGVRMNSNNEVTSYSPVTESWYDVNRMNRNGGNSPAGFVGQ